MALTKAFQDAINEFLMQAGLYKDVLQEKVDALDEKEKLTEAQEETKNGNCDQSAVFEEVLEAVETAIDAVEAIPE